MSAPVSSRGPSSASPSAAGLRRTPRATPRSARDSAGALDSPPWAPDDTLPTPLRSSATPTNTTLPPDSPPTAELAPAHGAGEAEHRSVSQLSDGRMHGSRTDHAQGGGDLLTDPVRATAPCPFRITAALATADPDLDIADITAPSAPAVLPAAPAPDGTAGSVHDTAEDRAPSRYSSELPTDSREVQEPRPADDGPQPRVLRRQNTAAPESPNHGAVGEQAARHGAPQHSAARSAQRARDDCADLPPGMVDTALLMVSSRRRAHGSMAALTARSAVTGHTTHREAHDVGWRSQSQPPLDAVQPEDYTQYPALVEKPPRGAAPAPNTPRRPRVLSSLRGLEHGGARALPPSLASPIRAAQSADVSFQSAEAGDFNGAPDSTAAAGEVDLEEDVEEDTASQVSSIDVDTAFQTVAKSSYAERHLLKQKIARFDHEASAALHESLQASIDAGRSASAIAHGRTTSPALPSNRGISAPTELGSPEVPGDQLSEESAGGADESWVETEGGDESGVKDAAADTQGPASPVIPELPLRAALGQPNRRSPRTPRTPRRRLQALVKQLRGGPVTGQSPDGGEGSSQRRSPVGSAGSTPRRATRLPERRRLVAMNAVLAKANTKQHFEIVRLRAVLTKAGLGHAALSPDAATATQGSSPSKSSSSAGVPPPLADRPPAFHPLSRAAAHLMIVATDVTVDAHSTVPDAASPQGEATAEEEGKKSKKARSKGKRSEQEEEEERRAAAASDAPRCTLQGIARAVQELASFASACCAADAEYIKLHRDLFGASGVVTPDRRSASAHPRDSTTASITAQDKDSAHQDDAEATAREAAKIAHQVSDTVHRAVAVLAGGIAGVQGAISATRADALKDGGESSRSAGKGRPTPRTAPVTAASTTAVSVSPLPLAEASLLAARRRLTGLSAEKAFASSTAKSAVTALEKVVQSQRAAKQEKLSAASGTVPAAAAADASPSLHDLAEASRSPSPARSDPSAEPRSELPSPIAGAVDLSAVVPPAALQTMDAADPKTARATAGGSAEERVLATLEQALAAEATASARRHAKELEKENATLRAEVQKTALRTAQLQLLVDLNASSSSLNGSLMRTPTTPSNSASSPKPSVSADRPVTEHPTSESNPEAKKCAPAVDTETAALAIDRLKRELHAAKQRHAIDLIKVRDECGRTVCDLQRRLKRKGLPADVPSAEKSTQCASVTVSPIPESARPPPLSALHRNVSDSTAGGMTPTVDNLRASLRAERAASEHRRLDADTAVDSMAAEIDAVCLERDAMAEQRDDYERTAEALRLAMDQQLSEKEQQIDALAAQVDDLQAALRDVEAERDEAEARADQEEGAAAEQRADLEATVAGLQAEVSALEERLDSANENAELASAGRLSFAGSAVAARPDDDAPRHTDPSDINAEPNAARELPMGAAARRPSVAAHRSSDVDSFDIDMAGFEWEERGPVVPPIGRARALTQPPAPPSAPSDAPGPIGAAPPETDAMSADSSGLPTPRPSHGASPRQTMTPDSVDLDLVITATTSNTKSTGTKPSAVPLLPAHPPAIKGVGTGASPRRPAADQWGQEGGRAEPLGDVDDLVGQLDDL